MHLFPCFFLVACSTAYKAKPLPFKLPGVYPNATKVAGATVGAKAFGEPKEAKEAFGFDIRAAGMFSVQVVFDHQGKHPLEINAAQTFLEDQEGNLWPVLARKMAYKRVTKYAQTKQIFNSILENLVLLSLDEQYVTLSRQPTVIEHMAIFTKKSRAIDSPASID